MLWGKCGENKQLKNRKQLYISHLRFNFVESEGFEPSSKQGINKLSTCVALI